MFNEAALRSTIDRFIESGAETGAAAVVMKDGKEVFKYGSGLMDAEKGKPFTPDTICRAFSCSKVVTGTAAMQLLERGLIDLDNPIEWYIPEFANAVYIREGKEIAASRPIKIRDLLNMTSGIAYPGDWHEGVEKLNNAWGELDNSCKNDKSIGTMEFAKLVGKCPIMFDAGAEWMYGSSADVFGAVAEAVTGKRYGEYLKENIFDPLGMNDTAFFVPKEKLDRLAVLYDGAGENKKPLDWVNLCIYDVTEEPAFQSGGAGLFSTASDFSKLGAALSCGGYLDAQILSRKAIDFMRTNGLTDVQRKTFNWDSCRGFGYANFVRTHEEPNVSGLLASRGAFGWDGWTGTYILNDPDESLAVILFVQRAGAGTTALSRAFVNHVYSMI
ncbi:MAG: beta-lactamase family protein [Ruminococcus sp.]|nr:beta-lactamase family protein [Ruminococcus sp.]MBR1752986.1 beta-lactamase family protein [Ruminococcus sp.]